MDVIHKTSSSSNKSIKSKVANVLSKGIVCDIGHIDPNILKKLSKSNKKIKKILPKDWDPDTDRNPDTIKKLKIYYKDDYDI